jgi:uncharacterized protein
MGWRVKYDVAFKGLKEGLHEFEYEIGTKFFEHFDQGMVNVGNLTVKIDLEKRSSFMKLYFNIQGWVELTCDRCLEKYRQKVKNKSEFFVKFGENEDENDDQIIWVLPEEHRINLAQLIYEYTVLSIPMKHIHPDKENGQTGCNKEMIERLNNFSPDAKEKNTDTDPRWEALRKLKK